MNNHVIKRQVPVRTFADWSEDQPGYFEADFVVHSGGSMRGSPVHSFVLTDVCSGWTESVPLIVREQSLVVEALRVLRHQLPVPLLGLDTDNDGAFMNETVLAYCNDEGIKQTRSRAHHKNDQAWIEQNNGAVVRRLVGYDRLEGAAATRVLARLYGVARLYVNFFQPSFKLKEKVPEGAKGAEDVPRAGEAVRSTASTPAGLGRREGRSPLPNANSWTRWSSFTNSGSVRATSPRWPGVRCRRTSSGPTSRSSCARCPCCGRGARSGPLTRKGQLVLAPGAKGRPVRLGLGGRGPMARTAPRGNAKAAIRATAGGSPRPIQARPATDPVATRPRLARPTGQGADPARRGRRGRGPVANPGGRRATFLNEATRWGEVVDAKQAGAPSNRAPACGGLGREAVATRPNTSLRTQRPSVAGVPQHPAQQGGAKKRVSQQETKRGNA